MEIFLKIFQILFQMNLHQLEIIVVKQKIIDYLVEMKIPDKMINELIILTILINKLNILYVKS